MLPKKAASPARRVSKTDLVDPEPSQWIRAEATVGDLMNPDVVTLYPTIPRWPPWWRWPSVRIHRIVVLETESKLAGIVTPVDVVRALALGAAFDVT